MIQRNAFQLSDGRLFASETEAKKEEEDLLGTELDRLLSIFKLDITRHQSYKALLSAMGPSKKELHVQIRKVLDILDFEDLEEI